MKQFNNWYKTCLFGLILGLMCACDSSSDSVSPDPGPSNLSVSSVVVGTDSNNPNGDGSGIVDFTITATDAMSYKVLINNETLELTQDTFSYTFTNSGTNDYTIIITAINSAGSTSLTYTVTVYLSTQLQLVWFDEFDGNGTIDTAKWAYDPGTPENNEEQIYTTDQSNTYIENGVLKITAIKGDANAATYYFDELNLLDSGGNIVSVIENFEGTAPTLNEFDGAVTQVIANPDISGENTTSKVLEFIKTEGSNGNSGVFWDKSSAIDPSVNNKISLKTWSPKIGAVVRLKLENSTNSSEFHLVDVNTSVSNAWETLIFDFSGAPAYNYDRVVVFFDHGNTVANYTSGRIITHNLYDFTYGTVEVRAKLPASQGTWPAIWMLGSNFGSVGWPACGEIDIMEQTGWDKNKILGTCHWSNNGNYAGFGLESSIANVATSFHIYKLEWTEGGAIRFFLDDNEFFVMSTNNSMPFNKDFFFILNVAMGGDLGGTIDPNFTQDTMEIDYVRVYQ